MRILNLRIKVRFILRLEDTSSDVVGCARLLDWPLKESRIRDYTMYVSFVALDSPMKLQ